MPRKPTLSPTKFSIYLACPTKYKWTYVDDRGKWYLRAKSYYSFGTTLHKVLQRFHDEGDHGVQTSGQAVAALEESWIDAGYESQEHMMQALAEGKEIVESYVEDRLAMPTTARTLYVEKTLRHDMGPFVLLGRVDRVDEHEDGTLEVIDYKSGRSGVTEEEVETDLAMNIYQYLLAHLHPGRPVCATIHALRAGASATARLDPGEMERFAEDLRTLGVEILERDYERLEPVVKDICPECDFLPLCSKHPEFELIQESGTGDQG